MRAARVLVVCALLVPACGQYQNVHRAGGETGVGGTGAGLQDSASLGGSSASTDGSVESTTGGTGSLDSGTSASSAGSAAGPDASVSGSVASRPPAAGEGDSTGVTPTTITIGIHAPLTGAAPIREDSFNDGRNLYWDFGNHGKPVEIFGRHVEAVFEDDHYNPSYARQVCQQMAEEDHAFLLMGAAGTDQIQSCAQYAASKGIPYLSAGVTEVGLTDLANYFTLSMTYPDQAPLLAQEIRHRFHVTEASEVAVVATDTANFDDTVAAFDQAFPGASVYRPSKNERGSTMAANLCTGTVPNFDVVFPLVSPTYYLEMAKAAHCHPQYAGVGLTMGLDSVANIGCPDTAGAQFFNPFPAWADRQKYDPDFEEAIAAARKEDPSFTDDDIVWFLWNLMKTVGVLLEKAGTDLTREGFIYSSEHATVSSVPGAPDLRYSPANHFGASTVANLVNVCTDSGGSYETKDTYRSSF